MPAFIQLTTYVTKLNTPMLTKCLRVFIRDLHIKGSVGCVAYKTLL